MPFSLPAVSMVLATLATFSIFLVPAPAPASETQTAVGVGGSKFRGQNLGGQNLGGGKGGGICEDAIAAAEARHQLPTSLLMAMGRVEAGWQGVIWPWSLNEAGQPRRYANRASAERRLAHLLENGNTRVDAGCLQLSLRWVGRGLSAVEALDPVRNADKAARHLAALRHDYGSWTEAVARYHSPRQHRGWRYVCRVFEEAMRLRTGRAGRHRDCVAGKR